MCKEDVVTQLVRTQERSAWACQVSQTLQLSLGHCPEHRIYLLPAAVGVHTAPRPPSWKTGDGSSLNPGKDSLGQPLWVVVPTS